jgi:glycosyltransferase involved in cell wall biosynthesis
VLAYPSHDEGFGFPVLEAQSASTPVVARAVGAVPEIAGDAAILVDRRDPELFAHALDRALSDGVVRLGLIESGHRNVQRFSWDTSADELTALYRRALNAASSSSS